MAQTITHLAKRIPFRFKMHLNVINCHSCRYTNARLGIGCEAHVRGETDPAGYFTPGPDKAELAFYRETPADSPIYDSLAELLRADAVLLAAARKFYGKRNRR